MDSYLDLSAAEIARKHDVIHSQMKALGRATIVKVKEPLFAVQDKQPRGDDPHTYSEFEQIFTFRDSNRQNKYKDETCTYCNKKDHAEEDDVYYTTRSKPKSDIILLKMDSGDAWFADASVHETYFKFLMDTGISKSVMSSKHFMSIPEMFQPQLCNTRMKFHVANREVLSSMGIAHISIQMYGHMFRLLIIICDHGDIDCIFGLDAGKEAGFIT